MVFQKGNKLGKKFVKGHIPWTKGRTLPEFSKRMMGKNNPMWRGDDVEYGSLHDYIKWHLPKTQLCQCCGLIPPYDCANISGEYRRNLSDWEWLCRKCHMVKDGRLEKLHESRRKYS